ncbi:hypothetical protein BDY21DRAFT_339698 [Lineolata rhizophorae]|uniref:Uncharacterized protein n=1 Tax=Lineolata rhizophorae TaxID=578093 RepID=A0A6A6P505_9PEZI|nr:hypothetical protein BDY21DRAFT_339698 [Lineolata rhizophorae]
MLPISSLYLRLSCHSCLPWNDLFESWILATVQCASTMAPTSSNDPHAGGSLEEMAPSGTSIPNDAGNMRTIPSVPRPDQANATELGEPNMAAAADNPTDIPRQGRDTGATGGVITGTGHQMPATAETKDLHFKSGDPGAKGHLRDAKHSKESSELETKQGTAEPEIEGPVGDKR